MSVSRGSVEEPESRLLAVARTLLIDRQLAEFTTVLADAGVPSIVLKGPSIARWLYSDGAARPYIDGDVLVPMESVERAEAVLLRLGFVHLPLDDLPYDKPWHGHAWARPHDDASIDLHRTLIGAGAPPPRVWEVLSQHVQVEEVAGVEVSMLTTEGRALLVALHAAQNGPSNPKSLEDLRRALQVVTGEGWKAAYDIAERIDALPALAAGLSLHPQGVQLAASLGLPAVLPIETILRASSARSVSLGLAWLFRLRGRDRLRFLYHKAFPPISFMRSWSPLAATGWAGLAVAYLWRPLWLLGHLFPALRDYLRAKQLTSRAEKSRSRH